MSGRTLALVNIYKSQVQRSHYMFMLANRVDHAMVAAYEIANEYRILYCLTGRKLYDGNAKLWEKQGDRLYEEFSQVDRSK